ncbi:NYN domain-containing protein [Spirochaetia bacterium 38H-sp]|uniref:NYN domain-containing protein n=1 Tax=Rarispira pelagica TaxID=3141764 RepID=A0ABU9U8F8_9SPIR
MNKRIVIGIYFDLENVNKNLDITALMDSVSLEIEEEKQALFAIKLACGNASSIRNFRDQLRDNNFEIREAPHVSRRNIKNRADLILSLEAFETLVVNKPEIDLYVFITSDTDFTVVMDKLRKYGKQVWLVTSGNTLNNKLFSSSSDKILNLENFLVGMEKERKASQHIPQVEIRGFSREHQLGILQVLESYEKDTWHPYSSFGTKIKNLLKDFSYKGKEYNSQTKLFKYLAEKNIIDIKKEGSTDYFKLK